MNTEYVTIQPPNARPIRHEVVELLTRRWWILAVQGLVIIALGLSTVIWPHAMLTVLAVAFGVSLTIAGTTALGLSLRMRSAHTRAAKH